MSVCICMYVRVQCFHVQTRNIVLSSKQKSDISVKTFLLWSALSYVETHEFALLGLCWTTYQIFELNLKIFNHNKYQNDAWNYDFIRKAFVNLVQKVHFLVIRDITAFKYKIHGHRDTWTWNGVMCKAWTMKGQFL